MKNSKIPQITDQANLRLKVEHPDDRTSRLSIKEKDADARRHRENFKFYGIASIIAAALIGCTAGAIWGDPVLRQWCLMSLASIISASTGYLAGESKGKRSPD